MSDLIIKKNGTDYELPMLAEHYPADRVYLHGNVDNDVEQILDSIKTKHIVGFDNLSDVTPTINNCYHNGIIAELNITFLSTSAKTGWNKIAEVSPAPNVDRNIPLFNGSTNEAIGYCLIEASGDVKILNMPNNTYLTIVGSYFLI